MFNVGSSPTLALTENDQLRLDAHLHDPQRWVCSRIKDYQGYIRKCNAYIHMLLTVYNTQAPIHRSLPPELFIEIFARFNPQKKRDIAVLHVCRTWRDLIFRTPDFWVALLQSPWEREYGRPRTSWVPDVFRTLLERTSPRNLHLNSMHLPLDRFVVPLTAHSHRISTLTLTLNASEIGHFLQIAKAGWSQLEDLTLLHDSFDRSFDPSPRTDLDPPSTLPRLKTLQLPTIFLQYSLHTNVLQELTVEGNHCAHCSGFDPMNHLLLFLSRCPTVVKLVCWLGLRAPSAGSQPQTSLALPHLSTIDISHVDTDWLSRLLSLLLLPPVCWLSFSTNSHDDKYIPDGIYHHARPLLSISDCRMSMLPLPGRFEDHPWLCTISLQTPGPKGESGAVHFNIGMCKPWRESSGPLLDQLLPIFPSSTLNSLRLSTDNLVYELEEAFLRRLLLACPSLTTLALDGPHPCRLLSALLAFNDSPPFPGNSATDRDSVPPGNTPFQLVCPHLERLHIMLYVDYEPKEPQALPNLHTQVYDDCELVASALERRARLALENEPSPPRLKSVTIGFVNVRSALKVSRDIQLPVVDLESTKDAILKRWDCLADEVTANFYARHNDFY